MMHTITALVSLVAVLLYAERSGWLYAQGSQAGWALVTRLGLGLVLTTIATGFMELAATGATFERRHWMVLAAMALAAVGHVGLFFKRDSLT